MTDNAEWFRAYAERRRQAQEESDEPVVIPEPEVRATPIAIGDSRLPAGAKQIINRATENDWTASATYSRGPWLRSDRATVVSISDFVLVRLDGKGCKAVASWRDGKFEFAYVGPNVRPVKSNVLKAILRGEEPCTSTEPDQGSTETLGERPA